MSDAVEVCPDCDIADCQHIRANRRESARPESATSSRRGAPISFNEWLPFGWMTMNNDHIARLAWDFAEAQAHDWCRVPHQNPPCDGETVFVGVNSAGYCGCFNEIEGQTCFYATAEERVCVMSDLVLWRELVIPGHNQYGGPSRE